MFTFSGYFPQQWNLRIVSERLLVIPLHLMLWASGRNARNPFICHIGYDGAVTTASSRCHTSYSTNIQHFPLKAIKNLQTQAIQREKTGSDL